MISLRRTGMFMVLVSATAASGCRAPAPVEQVVIPNQRLGAMTIAVAPALNQSGSAALDVNRFADLMASELGHATDVRVIPLSRVLAVLSAQGKERVESPAHALELTRILGADAILIFAVTEYDPYDPPSIGITSQLFGHVPGTGGGMADPVALSRRAAEGSEVRTGLPRGLLAEHQAVFDAGHRWTASDIRQFAIQRNAEGSPYGWRKFVVSQQQFIRYCCFATIRDMLSGKERVDLASGD